MALRIRKALIVYFSPAGSTEHVARVMERKLKEMETPVTAINLGREPDIPFIIPQLLDAKDNLCLHIGSPVYANHPVPPVMEFISSLPKAHEGFSVPFVTWGGATSGIALHVMGGALEEKGYRVLGAAKILAKHSLMWACDSPLGENHPDEEDDRLAEVLVETTCERFRRGETKGIPLSALRYQRDQIYEKMKATSLESRRPFFPNRRILQDRCTQCEICSAQCPVEAITLSPFPEFGPGCILCFNCVRLCPENAIEADLSEVHRRIRARRERFREEGSEIFL